MDWTWGDHGKAEAGVAGCGGGSGLFWAEEEKGGLAVMRNMLGKELGMGGDR